MSLTVILILVWFAGFVAHCIIAGWRDDLGEDFLLFAPAWFLFVPAFVFLLLGKELMKFGNRR